MNSVLAVSHAPTLIDEYSLIILPLSATITEFGTEWGKGLKLIVADISTRFRNLFREIAMCYDRRNCC